MERLAERNIIVPADVPAKARKAYIRNFLNLTHCTGKVFLFAGDQKIEHLNKDFYGETKLGKIADEDKDPIHLFDIASKAPISCLAVHPGLAARYGPSFRKVPLVIKMNGKTDLVKKETMDPISAQLVDFEHVLRLKENGLNILGVGYTIYLGSEFESAMLAEASRLISDAHKYGLITILWMYPRGKDVPHEKDPKIIAGAAGVAACIGADFVKLNFPSSPNPAEDFKEAVYAAGRTGVIVVGGESVSPTEYLERLHKEINISGARGNACGRNIHQKPLEEAVRLAKAAAAIIFKGSGVSEAMSIYNGNKDFKF